MEKMIGDTNKVKVNVLMRVLGARNFSELEQILETASGTISRIYYGHYRISHRIFLRAAIIADMRPSELMKKMRIKEDYFWSVMK